MGPIHLSELAVPLAIVAAAGIARGLAWLAATNRPRLPAGILVAGYLAVACSLFDVTNPASLHDSAAAQRGSFREATRLP